MMKRYLTKGLSTQSNMASPAKKVKSSNGMPFLQKLSDDRKETSKSIADFKFNKKRVQVLSDVKVVPDGVNGILYWMTREQRVQDNWSLLYAQKLALKTDVPLHVLFCLRPKFMEATIRHYKFMLKGLQEVATELESLNIPFHLIFSNDGAKEITSFVKKHNMGAVVIDFSPLKIGTLWAEQLKDSLSQTIPICQVDGHNIVPCWVASDKLEYGARTIRNKINNKLDEFLTKFPPVIKHPFDSELNTEKINWEEAESKLEVNMKVGEVDWAQPGYKAGMQMLDDFCEKRLKFFATKRNDPLGNALSNLSPWFHFGQISVQRCILHVRTFKSKYKDSVDAFCEEAIVRRELADNYCYYNKNYDNINGAYDWAKKTLNDHRKDKRDYLYTKEEWEKSLTHDDLWNSAQIQLVKEGKWRMYLRGECVDGECVMEKERRMYWAKKILEWSSSPEEALEIALYLNDKYSMDGRDPNGFVGCMWSICGIHDQGWAERQVFGKIRFMNYKGCQRKFDVSGFVARYGGKVHKKKVK